MVKHCRQRIGPTAPATTREKLHVLATVGQQLDRTSMSAQCQYSNLQIPCLHLLLVSSRSTCFFHCLLSNSFPVAGRKVESPQLKGLLFESAGVFSQGDKHFSSFSSELKDAEGKK